MKGDTITKNNKKNANCKDTEYKHVIYECKLQNCSNFSLADFEGDEMNIAV